MTTSHAAISSSFEPVAPESLVEARAFNDQLERLLAAQPSLHTVPVSVTRRIRREGGGLFPPAVHLPQAKDRTIRSRAGNLRLRVIAPDGPASGAYLHIHGGGWALGAADMQDPMLAALGQSTGLVVVSVDYRLAPEHPFPAGPDDCEDAALWLVEQGAAELGIPAGRLAIGGESAGAHLAATTLLRLRDRHGIAGAFRAANLVFGVYDLSMTPSARRWGARNLVLSGPIMEWFSGGFVPGIEREARRDASMSPLYADLRGMPPALFTVGALDPLLDDSLFMAARWAASGAPSRLRVWPEGVHGFTAFPLAIARTAQDAQLDFLRTL
jgi:acetyl esterase/lipase